MVALIEERADAPGGDGQDLNGLSCGPGSNWGGEMNEQNDLNAEDDELRRQIEYWPLDRLIPYARNARTHSAG